MSAEATNPRRALPARRIGRPSATESDDVNRSIVEAALREFRRKGFAGASIERIAGAANVTRTAVYRRYADKQALFASVVEGQIDLLEGLAREVCRTAADPLSALRVTAQELMNFVLSPVALDLQRIIIAEGESFPELARRVASPLPEKLADQLNTLIREAQRAKQLGEGPASLWRDVLLRLVAEGPRWQVLVGATPWSQKDADEHFAVMWPIFLKLSAAP